jgi:hypothetical protein
VQYNGSQYETHIIADAATAWLREVVVTPPAAAPAAPPAAAAAAAATAAAAAPFFAYIAPHSPHGAAIPEPKYAGAFGSAAQPPAQPRARAPRPPSWNASAATLADHHWLVAQQPPVTAVEARAADRAFARRWECLLSYDDLVGRVVEQVRALATRNSLWTSAVSFFYLLTHSLLFLHRCGRWASSTTRTSS